MTTVEAQDAVRTILNYIGEDPTREGLVDTPRRVVNALSEMTSGHAVDLAGIMATQFSLELDEMVVVSGIRFTSLCEHHLLPFTGTVAIGCIPQTAVLGLSKFGRIVEAFARRLQIQEQMTQQIADAIVDGLNTRGVGVIVKAKHSCMGCRGVRQADAEFTTSVMRGLFKENHSARSELLRLAQ